MMVRMDVQEYLSQLAEANRNGFGFLIAYGVTWTIAGLFAARLGEHVGAYAVLFQGVVGLPLGLALTSLGAAAPRPEDPRMNALSIYLAVGHLLAIPLVIVLIRSGKADLAVVVVSVVLAVHFVPYGWLYGTVVYPIVGAVIAVGSALLLGRNGTRSRVVAICWLVGAALLVGCVAAYLS